MSRIFKFGGEQIISYEEAWQRLKDSLKQNDSLDIIWDENAELIKVEEEDKISL